MRRRISLRTLLFVCFTVLSTVPVVLLGLWVQDAALKNEIKAVEEKHLLLARNLGGALDRYAADVSAVFRTVAGSLRDEVPIAQMGALLKSLHFRHVCVSDAQGNRDLTVPPLVAEDMSPPQSPRFPEALLPVFQAAAKDKNHVFFSGVTKDAKGRPSLFLVTALDDKRYVVGALATDYIVKIQKQITFGERGHAAIVDQYGRAMAHPLDSWRDSMKDMTFLPPVQRMLKGETGVIRFYTPAMKADVVAGYTSVPTTGWGAMIPQPFPELVSKANEVRLLALIIIFAGIVITAAISWRAARALSEPLHAMAETALLLSRETADPQPIPSAARFAPRELQDLVSAFNAMAGEVRTKNEELSLEAIRADVASRSKSDFLAHMSHELRTPLNAIIGFSEIMQAGTFGDMANDRYRGYVGDILMSARHLRELIDGVLDLTKAEAGALELSEETINLATLISDSLVFLRDMAETNHVALNIAVPPELPHLRGDMRVCRQVLLNLLSNAVKFTPEDGAVTVTAEDLGDDGLRVSVRDTGVGINPNDIPRITEPFAQLENPMKTRYTGTGLGLHLTKRFMELHGGTLDIESAPGQGTTVSVTFPSARRIV